MVTSYIGMQCVQRTAMLLSFAHIADLKYQTYRHAMYSESYVEDRHESYIDIQACNVSRNLSYQYQRHAMCTESYVAVVLCTHCRPIILVWHAMWLVPFARIADLSYQYYRHAMCAESYVAVPFAHIADLSYQYRRYAMFAENNVAVALYTHCGPLIFHNCCQHLWISFHSMYFTVKMK